MENNGSSDGPTTDRADAIRKLIYALAAVYVVASAVMITNLRMQVTELQQKEASVLAKADQRLEEIDSRIKLASDTLASQLGMTAKEFSARMADLQQSTSTQQKQQIARVHREMSGVATEVGNVKTDIAATRADLELAKAKLEHAIGDLGMQSGLIARTRDDLEVLKHKGDRNYYEFTLEKGRRPVPVSTVSLQLKKTDPKTSKFTLNVMADDKTIEKKDRNSLEPLQFYTGKDHLLYELVVNNIEKNRVSGYIATPKSVAQPISQ